MRPENWLRFVQISPFSGQWNRLDLCDEDLRALETLIMAGPTIASVIAGTNGLRKIRFSPRESGQGKSGAYRVFYTHFPDHGIVLLVAIISKSEQQNLSKAARNALAKVLGRIKGALDQGSIR